MLFSEALAESGAQVEDVCGDAEVTGIQMDSRRVAPGDLFACVPSANQDSHRFIPDAVAKGAAAILAHSEEGFSEACKLAACAWAKPGIEDFNDAAWRLAKSLCRNPSGSLLTIGVTGTNGKSTTAMLMRDMLEALGHRAAYIGTLGFHNSLEMRLLENTTPYAIELMNLIVEARASGATALTMEVSSHALKERRADGIEFDAAVFTNLTQDHLDFHGSMDDYEASKLRLFEELPRNSSKPFKMAFNADDPVGARWHRRFAGSLAFGGSTAPLFVEAIEMRVDRTRLRITFEGRNAEQDVPLGGSFNVSNCAAAAAGLLCSGFTFDQVVGSMASVRPVRGRFEAVPNDAGIGVLIDYAHTPDALIKLLDTVRELKPARVITVFGCGGDRDRTKRPKMAAVVTGRSDLSILTSDNPRTEDPQAILDDVAQGIQPGSNTEQVIDRREAINRAIEVANPGDVVVIAGKGHENYQIIGRVKHPMDDREMAIQALEGKA